MPMISGTMKRGRAETSAKTFAGSKKTPERRPNSFMTWNYVRVGARNGRKSASSYVVIDERSRDLRNLI
jgi:hypothetical protein